MRRWSISTLGGRNRLTESYLNGRDDGKELARLLPRQRGGYLEFVPGEDRRDYGGAHVKLDRRVRKRREDRVPLTIGRVPCV
jgi:hypothetical protein